MGLVASSMPNFESSFILESPHPEAVVEIGLITEVEVFSRVWLMRLEVSSLILDSSVSEVWLYLTGWVAMVAMGLIIEIGIFLASRLIGLEVSAVFQVDSCVIWDSPHPEVGRVAMGAMGLVIGIGTFMRLLLVDSDVSPVLHIEFCLTFDPHQGWVRLVPAGSVGLVDWVRLFMSLLMGSEVFSMFQAEPCLTLEPPHPSCEKSASLTEFNCSRLLESLSKTKFGKKI